MDQYYGIKMISKFSKLFKITPHWIMEFSMIIINDNQY